MPKVTFIGDEKSGKSCLLGRYHSNTFGSMPTVGAMLWTLKAQIENKKIKMEAWDTSGQERYRSLVPTYTRDASIIVINIALEKPEGAFDQQAFEKKLEKNLAEWQKICKDRVPNAVLVLALNKSDLMEGTGVSYAEIEKTAKEKYDIQAVGVTSAKTGTGVGELFTEIGKIAAPIQEQQEKQSQVKQPKFVEHDFDDELKMRRSRRIRFWITSAVIIALLVGIVLLFTFPPAGLVALLATTVVAGLTVGTVAGIGIAALSAIGLFGFAGLVLFNRRRARYTRLGQDFGMDHGEETLRKPDQTTSSETLGSFSKTPVGDHLLGRPSGEASSAAPGGAPAPGAGESPVAKK